MNRDAVFDLAAVVIAVGVAVVGVVAQDQDPPLLPATTQVDLYVARVAALERELVSTRADLLKREIDLSTCHATLDSVTLSDRATKLVEEFKRIYGGEWIWNPEQNRPVRPAAGPKE